MIMADILNRGYKVLLPLGEDWRFDLVIYRNSKFERIQCKYDGVNTDFCEVRCRSCNNWGTYKYKQKDIDWMACYHKATNKCYYIPGTILGEIGRTGIILRINPTKNNQKYNILYAKDFVNI